jgi:hypothetical protein
MTEPKLSAEITNALYQRAMGRCECQRMNCKHPKELWHPRCTNILREDWAAHLIDSGGKCALPNLEALCRQCRVQTLPVRLPLARMLLQCAREENSDFASYLHPQARAYRVNCLILRSFILAPTFATELQRTNDAELTECASSDPALRVDSTGLDVSNNQRWEMGRVTLCA